MVCLESDFKESMVNSLSNFSDTGDDSIVGELSYLASMSSVGAGGAVLHAALIGFSAMSVMISVVPTQERSKGSRE